MRSGGEIIVDALTPTAAFGPALEHALAEEGPSLIEIVLDGEIVSSRATLTVVRERALSAK